MIGPFHLFAFSCLIMFSGFLIHDPLRFYHSQIMDLLFWQLDDLVHRLHLWNIHFHIYFISNKIVKRVAKMDIPKII